MLPIERRSKIKELVLKKGNIKIGELSKVLAVSEMTIHRDLKPLLEEGYILKTFGGITLNQKQNKIMNSGCVYCSRDIHEKMAYRLILAHNKIEMTCCAHCGLLRHRQHGSNVVQAICHDFFRQTTISALATSYVMNTSIDIGCCQPQVLTFEWKEHAENFVKGFGGNVYSFDEAMENVFEMMGKVDQNCHHNNV